jgi:hypothetical protein
MVMKSGHRARVDEFRERYRVQRALEQFLEEVRTLDKLDAEGVRLAKKVGADREG